MIGIKESTYKRGDAYSPASARGRRSGTVSTMRPRVVVPVLALHTVRGYRNDRRSTQRHVSPVIGVKNFSCYF